MAQKIPPPPFMVGPEWEGFNRWLLELTSVLTNEGGINPEEVTGLPATIALVAANTLAIANLQTTTGSQGGAITGLQAQINFLTTQITVLNSSVTTLAARAQVLRGAGAPAAGLGNVNDWYADTTNLHIYVKTAAATWTLII